MRRILFTQVMINSGKSTFSGLFDKDGNPVDVELEKDDEGAALTILRKDISAEERLDICEQFDYDCDSCPKAMECCQGEFNEDTCC